MTPADLRTSAPPNLRTAREQNGVRTCGGAEVRRLMVVLLVVASCDALPGKPTADDMPRRPEQVVDFEQLYGDNCAGCHGAGVLGAPKTGDKAAWAARLSAAGGLDGLVGHAVTGKNSMPPKGGDASLSDQEVHDAVVYLLKQSGI